MFDRMTGSLKLDEEDCYSAFYGSAADYYSSQTTPDKQTGNYPYDLLMREEKTRENVSRHIGRECVSKSLRRIVDTISCEMFLTSEHYALDGYVNCLAQLSRRYPPVLYPQSWGVVSGKREPVCLGLLSHINDITNTSDTAYLANVVVLSNNLLCGIASSSIGQGKQTNF